MQLETSTSLSAKSGAEAGKSDAEVHEPDAQGCPMSGLLETLTRPWTFHILWQLSTQGPMRFGALRRAITGISARLLTVRLRALEAEGFVRRTVMGGKIPEVTYSPTSRLSDMNEIMDKLHGLSLKWRHEDHGVPPAAELHNALRRS